MVHEERVKVMKLHAGATIFLLSGCALTSKGTAADWSIDRSLVSDMPRGAVFGGTEDLWVSPSPVTGGDGPQTIHNLVLLQH